MFLGRLLVLGLAARTVFAQEPVAVKPRLPPRDSLFDSTFVALQSQDSAARAHAAQPNCWRPHQSPGCPGFFITELGVETPVASSRRDDPLASDPRRRDFTTRIVWTLGFMGNDKHRNAYGGAISFTSDDWEDALPLLAEARYKRWLGPSVTADAGLGYKSANVWQPGRGWVHANGVSAMVGLTPNRFIGLRVRGDVVRGGGRTAGTFMLGATSGWLSENVMRFTAIAIFRAILGKIGIELEDEE